MKQKIDNIENRQGFPEMETGFTVPEGYFESFGERLNLRMEAELQSSRRRRNLIFYLKPALGLAAGLAIILTVFRYPPGNQRTATIEKMQTVSVASVEDQKDPLPGTYALLLTDGQFFAALNEMDEYDAAKLPKDELAEYLASNCSDFEIINANK
jgi:hypothetical protein